MRAKSSRSNWSHCPKRSTTKKVGGRMSNNNYMKRRCTEPRVTNLCTNPKGERFAKIHPLETSPHIKGSSSNVVLHICTCTTHRRRTPPTRKRTDMQHSKRDQNISALLIPPRQPRHALLRNYRRRRKRQMPHHTSNQRTRRLRECSDKKRPSPALRFYQMERRDRCGHGHRAEDHLDRVRGQVCPGTLEECITVVVL